MDWKSGIFHCPSGIYLEEDSGQLTLRLRVPQGAPVSAVFLRWTPDGEQDMLSMTPSTTRLPGWECDWWEISLARRNPRFHYRFWLLTDQGGWWLTARGLRRTVPTDASDFVHLAQLPPPWLADSVFYQIFPERFCDGDPSNNVKDGEYLVDGKPSLARPWGELPQVDQGAREFFGGDLQGIEQRLDYLQERLGINALYLNPIFTSPSSHKYDVASYTEVDPHLGGESAFLSLRQALSQRGMRLVLDIVPNHCGREHPWFQAALKNPKAPTAEYFTFRNYPEDYECWLGVRSLPKLNYASLKLREEMFLGENSIMRRWLRPPYSLDGWRLDVANMLARQGHQELGPKILRGIRRAVKAENPECYLLGENFFDGSASIQGDQLDGVMNYRGFMMPLYHWLTGSDYHALSGQAWGDRHPLETEQLEQQWAHWRANVPWASVCAQLNLLDSHDTPRLLTLVDNDSHLAAVARLLLFTYPGVACLYYGDEIGMCGGRDPDNRRCMEWDENQWDPDMFSDWQRLIRLRRSHPALARGSYQVLCSQHNTLAFMREAAQQRLLVVVRRGADDRMALSLVPAAVPEGTPFKEFFSGRMTTVQQGHLALLPDSRQLWIQVA